VTGKVPFSEYTDQNVIVMVAKGDRPLRPRSIDASGMTPGVWEVARQCWDEDPDKRLEVNAVLQALKPLGKSGVCADKLSKVEGF
jgi:hypothetical protein